MKRRAIIVDLDGTLANCTHRLHYIKKKKKDWGGFYSEVSKDKVNEWCKAILSRFEMDLHNTAILIVTGRRDTTREDTIIWLDKNKIPYDELFMREYDDFRDDAIIKEELYKTEIKDKYSVLFVLEDRKRVVDMWRRLGLTVLQCAEGDY